jgi:hypothetical protein
MIRKATKPPRRDSGRVTSRQTARLDALIQEAIVDAYDARQAPAFRPVRRAYLRGLLTSQRFGVRSRRFHREDVLDWIRRGAPTKVS